MHDITGNLFESEKADAICITTNGFVNVHGGNTMGRGCAGEAKRRWPGIQMHVGAAIRHGGNNCRLLTAKENERERDSICLAAIEGWPSHIVPYHILTFPTKPEECRFVDLLPHYSRQHVLEVSTSERFPGWKARSSLTLIERSAWQLAELTDQQNWKSVVLPRPGCGAGELSWDEVRPRLSTILDARFYVINFPTKERTFLSK